MTGTEVSAPSVAEVLAALDRASLLPLLPAEEGNLLAGPVARVAAGVELSIEDQRAAARLLQAARPWLEGPLASLGLSIPPPPEPVTHRPHVSTEAQQEPMAKIVDNGQRIGVRHVRQVVDVIKALPGAKPALVNRWYVHESQVSTWHTHTVPATPAGAHNLITALEPFGMRLSTPERKGTVSKGVQALYEQYDAARDARAFLADGAPLPDVDHATYGVGAELWGHQHRAVAFGEASAATLMAIKMGGGKTISAIAIANRVQAGSVLIVCPNRVRAVWTREVRERSRVSWHIVDGTRAPMRRGAKRQNLTHPERVAQCNQVLFDCDCGAAVHAFVINYEALLQRVWQEWTPAGKLDLIIYDEGHRLKNYKLKVDPPKAGPGKEEKRIRAEVAAAKRRAARGVDDVETREWIEQADERIKAAKALDSMGERERELRRLCAPEEPPLRELRAARTYDKIEAKRDAEFRASKLTVSGVAHRWLAWSHRRVTLTGTPFPQHPWDIFGLYRALDSGVFGAVWSDFKDEFVEMDQTGTYPKRIKPEKLAEFAEKCMSLMYRPVVDLNLPGCTDVVREVELEDEARKAYDQLDTELWADLTPFMAERVAHGLPVSDGDVVEAVRQAVELEGPAEVTAHNVLTRLLRLQQLTGGTLRTDDVEDASGHVIPGPEARVSTAKTDALAEFEGKTLTGGILEEIGCVPGRTDADGEPVAPEPVIVFCRFKSDLDAVREVARKAGLRYGEISGRRGDGLNADARMAADKDLVAVQIQAGGTGVDLTRARYGIWYSLGYSVSDYDQARARLYRPGQTRPVVYIHLLATETADAQVYAAIRARKAAVAEVLRAGGVDPSELGLQEADPGPDPTAEPVEGIDASTTAVELPWEK